MQGMTPQETEKDTKSSMFDSLTQKWQYVLDKLSPQILLRWIMMTVVICLYFLRVYYLNGWFIVTYGLGIYMLNQLIGFLSPQVCFFVVVFDFSFDF